VSLFVGVGIPIPILDEEMVNFAAVRDRDIKTVILDYGIPSRSRPVIKTVNYEELKSGEIELNGKRVPTAPLSSIYKARQIAEILKDWIKKGKFLLQQPVEQLPKDIQFKPLNIEECE
jgi:uncharacterized protein (DUF39 family)